MKVSELTTSTLQEYLHTEDENLQLYLDGAISFVKNYAGLTAEQMDAAPEIALCVLTVASDMYDNRQMQVDARNNSYLNKLVESMLGMHSYNLL